MKFGRRELPQVFDTTKFIKDQFGHPEAITTLVSAIGIDPPANDTIRKWFERGAVPGPWWPVLIGALEKHNHGPVSVVGYLYSIGAHHDIFD